LNGLLPASPKLWSKGFTKRGSQGVSLGYSGRSLQTWADLFKILVKSDVIRQGRMCQEGPKGPGSQGFPKEALGTLRQQDENAVGDQH